ncbi:peptidoglycan-binding protein [Streptomyces nodosus]|uniref:peptidoglycan-binding protein n=1 Tax=Streptomyces nodosus TaxID=40318 RepID=UPI0036DFC653
MTDLWMPGAARHPLGNTAAMNSGPARAVWHITSNARDWTFTNELGWFTGGGTDVAPHLLWDPFTGEIAQFFPADSRALALQNAGTVKTNRTGAYCIQIETVFTAGETVDGKRYATVRDTPCKDLDRIMAWLRSLGIPDVWPGGAPTAFARDTVSMDTWLNRGGHYGHHQIPGNTHVDPGPMPDLFTATPGSDPGSGPNTSPAPPEIARYQVTVNGLQYGYGAHGDHVTKVGQALVTKGFGRHYKVGPSPDWSDADTLNYSDYQVSLGYTGTAPHQDADGVPGPTTLKQLLGSLPAAPASAPAPSPASACPPFPGRQCFVLGAHNDYALQLQKWLDKGGWGPKYQVGPSRTMTAVDLAKVKALQQHYLKDLGPADGLTGPKTWLYAWQVANGLRKK